MKKVSSGGEEEVGISKRGPSLMEMHLQSKHSKQPETFSGGRVPFNREKVCCSCSFSVVVDLLVGLNGWMYVVIKYM